MAFIMSTLLTTSIIFLDKDLPEKVNVLVTEIFDSELIGEGVLPTMRHARKSLLLVRKHRDSSNYYLNNRSSPQWFDFFI